MVAADLINFLRELVLFFSIIKILSSKLVNENIIKYHHCPVNLQILNLICIRS
jgi:hypothetical protein